MERTDPENESSRYPTIGRLGVYVVSDVRTWNGSIEGCDRYLLDFTGSDWDALFQDVFNCTEPEPFLDGENIEEYEAQYRLRIQECVSAHPMLGRIWNMYADAHYLNDETKELLDECQKLRSTTEHAGALRALDKLLASCQEALKEDRGLFLASG